MDEITNTRLISMENDLRDVNKSLGKVESTLEHVAKTLDTSHKHLQDAIIANQKALVDHRSDLDTLKKDYAHRVKRTATVKNVLKKMTIPAVVASAGVVGSSFGHQILEWIKLLVK